MKKFISLCLIMASFIMLFSGCSAEETPVEPELEQIKNICQLATLECRYNNVADGEKEKHEGLKGLFEKERDYWVEYKGVAKLGIDMNKVSMSIDGDTVTITIPKAVITDTNIDSKSPYRIVASEDGFLNKNEITVEKQQEAVVTAQEKMLETLNNSSSLFTVAQERAKVLIENYINTMSEISGKEYTIKWKDAE